MGAADRLYLTEPFTRTGRDTIDYQVTLDDPTTWVKPWTALVRAQPRTTSTSSRATKGTST